MSMQPQPWPEPAPEIAAAMRRKYAKRKAPLAVTVRDRLGEWLHDEDFAAAFGVRGRPGWSPARLALITVLQMAENLDDRGAAEAVADRLSWQYALGLGLDDEGFDHTVLSEFRSRVVAHGLEEHVLDALLERLASEHLVAAGGKQRTDSTHVISAVRDLNSVELIGESVRACLEAVAAAAPDWLAAAVCVADFSRRYGSRVDTWRLPATKTKRDELAVAYAADGYRLVEACYGESAPGWLRDLPAVQVLRVVLVQNYTRAITGGREVVRRRRAGSEGGDGVPPGHVKIASPYDTDARWSVKRDTFWCGYKLHITETCDDARQGCDCETASGTQEAAPRSGHRGERPNLITNAATTAATVPGNQMTGPIHEVLQARGLTPGRHYLDSGYPSASLVVSSLHEFGIVLVTPLLAGTSPQARAGRGYDRPAFTTGYGTEAAICPQGQLSASWSPAAQRGTTAIVVTFDTATCAPCPVRELCTTSKRNRRQLTIWPREVHQAQAEGRATQTSKDFQAGYARRAGVEGTMRQTVAVCGSRRARYRGLPKTRLEHIYSATALNLIRLDAYWNHQPLDRRRTSHLARLELALAA